MKLAGLLKDMEYEVLRGSLDTDIEALVYDSRKADKNCLFVCIQGSNADGHDFVEDVSLAGAAAIVVSEDIELPAGDAVIIKVSDTRYALACISAAYFGHPAKKLSIIGVTGTKGKTTTTYLIKSILENAGRKVGLIGTIEVIIGDEHIHAGNTTPESYLLQKYFRQMADAGLDTVVMEASSQAFKLHRTAGFVFDYGIFTNLSPDHIGPNEHASFEEYTECKSMLFRQCRVGIVNGDDEHLGEVIKNHTCELETFGMKPNLDIWAENVRLLNEKGSLGVAFNTKGLMELNIELPMPGLFSVHNALAAIAICAHYNVSRKDVTDAVKNAKVKGRIEPVKVSDDFTLLIDYAHNAVALQSIITALREYKPKRIVTVFGCGGNRAKSRRFEMGEVSGRLSDFTIITSDNPRFEEPLDIIADIRTGIDKTSGKYIEIPDRKEAIKYAIEHGEPGDIIILAGKGHEDYQEIKGTKYPMDERTLIEEALKELSEEKA